MASRHSFGSNLSISTKGLLLVAVPVVAQIAMLWMLRTQQTNILEAERWAIHSKDVILRADELQRAAIQAVANQRGAVVTGDANFRDTPGAVESLPSQVDPLLALVADNPAQQTQLGVLRRQLEALETWLNEQRDLVRQGRQADAAQRIRDREGTRQLQAVREALAAFLTEEERLSTTRSGDLRGATERARLMTLIAAAVSFSIACIFGYLFSRAISVRFAVLTSNAARLAERGELTTPLDGSDEIATLDRAMHETSSRLAAASAATEQAQRELEARLSELAQLNHELHQKTEENETFIYSVSHDLRSPLVNLQGFSKELSLACISLEGLLKDDRIPREVRVKVSDVIDRDIAECVRFIRTAVTRAGDIIDSLLRLSRAGRVEYRVGQVNTNRIVRNVIDAMRATIAEKRAEVVVRPLDETWGDATAIEQVFANLIGNAVNYLDPTRPGRIEIGMVDPSPTPEAGSRTYYVRDNGLGIPEGALSKVFAAFLRHHPQHAPGEGIGLALARRIVERHRGRIWLESKEGEGSTFYVELPTGGTEW